MRMTSPRIISGETKRPLRLRYNEHFRDAIGRKEDTPMGDHFRMVHAQTDHSPPPFEVRVLTTVHGERPSSGLFQKAFYIKFVVCSL